MDQSRPNELTMCDTNVKLNGKVAIVTGGSSGIGLEAAKKLANLGARVIIASRNETKLIQARNLIEKSTGNSNVDYKVLDLASLKSVRSFAVETKYEPRLDILVNNAGAVGLPDILTDDGINLTMQVNFFGTFLLTYLLLPMLRKSAPSRIVNVSAASMYVGEIDFDHWNDIGKYSAITVLANSKLAMTLFTAELDRKLEGTGVTANSFDPFVVRDTEILINIPDTLRNVSRYFIDIIGQRKEDVGRQIAFLAAAPELKNISGGHFKFCAKWANHWLANDLQITGRLWDEAKKIVKITEEELT